MDTDTNIVGCITPWNRGKLLGQKPQLKLKEIWAIQIRLQLDHRARELAMFKEVGRSRQGGVEREVLAASPTPKGIRLRADISACRAAH